MPFEKGQPRPANAGRRKGTLNVATLEFKDTLARILAEPKTEGKLRDLLDSDDPADRATFWRMAAKFVPAKVEAEVRGTMIQLVDLSDQRKDDDGLAEG